MDLSASTLGNLVKTLFKEVADCAQGILFSLQKSEHTIELDYRGWYFFELLQNACDAAAAVFNQQLPTFTLTNLQSYGR